MHIKHLLEKRVLRNTLITVSVCALFSAVFFSMFTDRAREIVDPEFRSGDEVFNGAVTANLTRDAFPPMVRLNPLITKQGHWTQGPYWQHIPPLFLYVPLPFFELFNNGEPDQGLLRLSYITILYLTCIIFIVGIASLEKNRTAIISAFIACTLLLLTPFTLNNALGYVINHSDSVLLLSTTLSLIALLYYLRRPQAKRLEYSPYTIALIAFIVTLPIVVKTALGAIPLAFFTLFIVRDTKKLFSKKIALVAFTSIATLLVAYGPLYISSPETFIKEMMTPFNHLSGKGEGPIHPWNYYFTHSLPNDYLGALTIPFCILLVWSMYLSIKYPFPRTTRNTLLITLIWFIWNFIAISSAATKVPNFLFQSYLFILFFVTYTPLRFLTLTIYNNRKNLTIKKSKSSTTFYIAGSLFLICIGTYSGFLFVKAIHNERLQAPTDSNREDRYNTLGRELKERGVNRNDLVIIASNVSTKSRSKYYVIFQTGAESEIWQTIKDRKVKSITIAERYKNVYLVLKNIVSDTQKLSVPHTTFDTKAFTVIKFKGDDIDNFFLKDTESFLREIKQ